MTDPFAEDIVPAESMQSLHEALLAEKVVPEGHHGGQWVARETLIPLGGDARIFRKPVLGCFEAEFCEEIILHMHFAASFKFSFNHLCTAPDSKM